MKKLIKKYQLTEEFALVILLIHFIIVATIVSFAMGITIPAFLIVMVLANLGSAFLYIRHKKKEKKANPV